MINNKRMYFYIYSFIFLTFFSKRNECMFEINIYYLIIYYVYIYMKCHWRHIHKNLLFLKVQKMTCKPVVNSLADKEKRK